MAAIVQQADFVAVPLKALREVLHPRRWQGKRLQARPGKAFEQAGVFFGDVAQKAAFAVVGKCEDEVHGKELGVNSFVRNPSAQRAFAGRVSQ